MSVLPQLGKEVSFQALGRQWTVGRWSMTVWDELIKLARPAFGDPFEGLDKLLPLVGPEQQERILSEALKIKRRALSIGSPEMQGWLNTTEGQLALFYLLLKSKHPDITRDEVLDITLEIGAQGQQEIFTAASGTLPAGNAVAQAA